MTGRYKLQKQVKRQDVVKADEQVLIPGTLGLTIGGGKKVEVPNRIGYVYVRIRGDLSEVVQAYNDKVALVYDLPVLLIRDKVDKNKYRIYDRDISRYIYWGSSNYIPEHGLTHTFDPNTPGEDIVWVWGRQIMPLAATPSGTVGGPNVIIQEAVWYQNTDWHYFSTTGSQNLIPDYKPTGSSANITLLYIDANGNPALASGSSFDASYTGTSQVISYLPTLPDSYGIPVAGIRLVSGSSVIGWDNIYDLRPWLIGDGFVPTGTANGHIIEYNGTPLTDRSTLNVLGTGLVAYDDGTKTILSGTASGVNTFLELTDTPVNYTGSALKVVRVNVGESALEFTDITGSSGVDTFLELTDTPAAYSGQASKLVVVNQDENGLVFLSNTGTASTLSFPAWRIPYSDVSGTLVTDDKFTNTAVNDYPSIRIGGVGDFESVDEGFALNLISTESSPLGLWGYRGEYFEPELYFYSANGTEATPTAILKEDNLGSILFYGYSNDNNWASSFYVENIASEDFTDVHRASYLQFRVMQTGSATVSPAFAIQQNHAKFSQCVQVPIYGAYYIGGSEIVNGQYNTTMDIFSTGTWRISDIDGGLYFSWYNISSDQWNTGFIITKAGVSHSILTNLTADDHSQYLVKFPGTTARNGISGAGDITLLRLTANASQTLPLLLFLDSDANTLSNINATGNFVDNAFTASRVAISDSNKQLVTSIISSNELGHLSGTVSNIGIEFKNRVFLQPIADQTINVSGGDFDLTIEGDTDPYLLKVDAGSDRIGIGTNSPLTKLNVIPAAAWDGISMHSGTTSSSVSFLGTDASFHGALFLYPNNSTGTISLRSNPEQSSYFNSGNVAFGKTTADRKVDLLGIFRIKNTSDAGHGVDFMTSGVTNVYGYGRSMLVITPTNADATYPGVQFVIQNYDTTQTFRAASFSFKDGDGSEMHAFGVTATSVFLDTPTVNTSLIWRMGTGYAQRLILTTDGHLTPGANKTQNLGAAGTRWNTLYQGTSTAAGTSRTFKSKKVCPVCKTKMIRGSGSLCILGEDRDYEVAMCPSCGILATEEIQHLPKEKLSKRNKPPKIEFLGFEVFEMSGNSRKVRVDFEYQAEEIEINGIYTRILVPAIKNSTYLGEEELEEFLSMNENQRETFLLDLGQREWDALEEIRLIKEEVGLLQSELDGKIKNIKRKNLLKG